MKVPPKIKFFIWRACRNCLTNRINLQKRGIHVSSLCVVCNVELESEWHTFISCPFARGCWERANLIQAVDSQSRDSEGFSEWLFNSIGALGDLEQGNFATILSAIWKQRNSKLWDNRIDSPSRVVATSKSFLYEWIAASRKDETPQTSSSRNQLCIWTPPPIGAVKCNIDAAIFEDIEVAGIGMVVRDEKGRFIKVRTTLIKGLRCVKEGEALCLFEALSWIRNEDFTTVLFEVDSQLVFQAVKATNADLTEFGGIIEQCRELLSINPNFSVHLVRRQANEIAHVLAKHSRFYASPFVWLETPICIGELLSL